MMAAVSVPYTLPTGIQRELDAAKDRTGWTPELNKAAERLPSILSMTPDEFHRFSASIYQRSI